MENSKMCNWVIVSLANTRVLVFSRILVSPEPPLLSLQKRGCGGMLWGGVCRRRVPHPQQNLSRFPQGFCEQLGPHVSLRQWSQSLGGLSPQQGLQGGAAAPDFSKPRVCTRSFARSSGKELGTNRERDAGTSESCQWTSREWLSGEYKSKLMMEKMPGSSWRARSVLSSGTFTLTVSACTCMGTPCSVGPCGTQWGTGKPHLTSPHLLLFCCLLSTS